MWLINWIGLTINNIVMAYCMFFGMDGIIGYILGSVFVVNTGVILWMWFNWPTENYESTGNKFGRKTPTVLKHTYNKRYY